MIKTLLIISILLCSVLIGIAIKRYFLNRFNFFSSLKKLCGDIKNQMSFLKTDKASLLLSDVYDRQVNAFLREYVQNGQAHLSILNNEEEIKINEFLDSIGHKDIDGEMNNIEYYSSYIVDRLSFSENQLSKYGNFAIKMSLILGTILAIIFM